jgi:ribosomal protein S18 acetylase RimI-like enzyme
VEKLEFKPIDLKTHLDTVIRFREDSFVCSYGSPERFEAQKDQYLAAIERKLDTDPRTAVHVWQGDEIVGQVELGSHKMNPSIGYVNLYYLRPDKRGTGLGVALDEYATRTLRLKGHRSVQLSVSETNERAKRFYQRMGFDDLGPRPDLPDTHFMGKKL